MILTQRIVIDTNVLVSAAVFASLIPRKALSATLSRAQVLASEATLAELHEVLLRPKFAKAARLELREAFFQEYALRCELISVYSSIQACRHPKDDKFLELAVDGRADLILSGDQDLLVLSPFRGISVVTPLQYLAED